MNQDTEQLRLLSIFHYVISGLAALFSAIPLLYIVLGTVMRRGDFGHQDKVGRLIGGFITALGAGVFLAIIIYVVCMVMAAIYLREHKHHTFCLVMAGISCVFMPFGTVLGVLTIIVLSRDSVKVLFQANG